MKRLHRREREVIAAYAFLLPDLTGLAIFVVLPMVVALAVAFYDVSGFGGFEFVGLENFARLRDDARLHDSLVVTGLYVAMFVPFTFTASLGLALLVRRPFKGVGVVRALYFLPHVVSLVVLGLLWRFLLIDKTGPFAWLVRPLGLGDVSWLGDQSVALVTVVLISVWFTMGYEILIFVGGLQDIPPELEEAASLDGASAIERFRYVIWPLLKPTSFFVFIHSIIIAVTGVQAFDLIYVLTGGGPADSTTTVLFYIYEQAFDANRLGYAAAITCLVVLGLFLLTAALFRASRGGRVEDGSGR